MNTVKRILQLHNKYQQYGGEDAVVMLEYELLKKNGNEVEQLFFDNKNISSSISDKIMAGFSSVYSFSSVKIVEKKIVEFKPDLIHVHNFFPLLSPSIFYIARKNKIPIVMTIHNFRLICSNALLFRDGNICETCVSKVIPLSGILHKCYRKSSLQSSAVTMMSSIHKIIGTWKKMIDSYIVLTEFGKFKFVNSSLNLPPEKIIVKPNFVADFGVGNDKREDYYVFFGRLSEEKGIEILLNSLKFYNFNLKIIGDGPLKDLVEKCASRYPHIEFVGFKDKEYIINVLKNSRCVIFPSIWYEGLPLSIIEALSTGTPIIISNLPPFKELIRDGYTGFHFINGCAEDLAQKIKQMDDNIDSFGHLYLNARKTYLEKYTPEINYDQLINIYQNVIDNYEEKKNN